MQLTSEYTCVRSASHSDKEAIKGPLHENLSRHERELLEKVEDFPEGVLIHGIKDKGTLKSLIKKGYLESYPGGRVRSLGLFASRKFH